MTPTLDPPQCPTKNQAGVIQKPGRDSLLEITRKSVENAIETLEPPMVFTPQLPPVLFTSPTWSHSDVGCSTAWHGSQRGYHLGGGPCVGSMAAAVMAFVGSWGEALPFDEHIMATLVDSGSGFPTLSDLHPVRPSPRVRTRLNHPVFDIKRVFAVRGNMDPCLP